MDESSEAPKDPFDVGEFLGKFMKVSGGHEGKMDNPEYVEMEVRNKLASLSSKIEIWKMKKAPEETKRDLAVRGVKMVVDKYSDYSGKVKGWVEESRVLGQYKDDIFPPKEDER